MTDIERLRRLASEGDIEACKELARLETRQGAPCDDGYAIFCGPLTTDQIPDCECRSCETMRRAVILEEIETARRVRNVMDGQGMLAEFERWTEEFQRRRGTR